MKNDIKYIGFYDVPDSKCDRICGLAAANKMNYVCDVLNRIGYNVNIISPSWMGRNSEVKFEKGKTVEIHSGLKVTFCPSWMTHNKVTGSIKILFSLVWLLYYLLVNANKDEKILAYHTPWISLPIRLAKLIKRFKLVLEIEEIYSDVWNSFKMFRKTEMKLINAADAYILVSDVLKSRLNLNNKNSIVLYGSYIPVRKQMNRDSENINLVYAGSVDTTKAGAFNAVKAMQYLPDYYKLYIIGDGSKENLSKLESLIKEVNAACKREACVYNGILHGEEYSDYLLKCDIALNPQHVGDYMVTAFPSKVLSYLSHNLRVVSTEIESIKKSSVSEYIVYAKSDNPRDFAEAILSVNLNTSYSCVSVIEKLDSEFLNSIKSILC